MRMTRAQWDELVAHARDDMPNECCGYLRMEDGSVAETFRAKNLRASPYGYELDSKSLFAVNDLDDEGHGVGIYHSHPRSAPDPSQTDINLAHYPHWLYLIVSLQSEPVIKAWRIEDGRVQEEPIDVE
jgi:proteasome lid subunit RPN8/RPN11